jgi:pimeloyl-ACP methyl ester carboxylesterase
MADPDAVMPFAPRADSAVLEDLRRRLLATEWPDAPAGVGWSAGIDVDDLRKLVAYWADGFDWRAVEERLNRLPRFRTAIDGLGIHFIHARASADSPPAMPLLLAHGWPDSFWRYSQVVSLLVDPGAHGGDPADAFDVVVPDMPGFGYSDRPPQTLDTIAVAGLWARLMDRLGYSRFAAAGSDIGSDVVCWLALDHLERIDAVHLTDAVFTLSVDRAGLTEEERVWLGRLDRWEHEEGAYGAMQSTKPQTAAVGLTDSPAGLAAWIVEKLHAWSDRRPDGTSLIDRDAMLTNLTIYWLTGTIGSSIRMYKANAAIPETELSRTIAVPTGYTLFPADIEPPAPNAWLARTTTDLARVSRPGRGGHFVAIEDPELYATELREFFRPYRSV